MLKLRFLGPALTVLTLPLAAYAQAPATPAATTTEAAASATPAAEGTTTQAASGNVSAGGAVTAPGLTDVEPPANAAAANTPSEMVAEPAPPSSGALLSVPGLVEGFSDGYNFSAPGRINGIRNGSLAPTGHGRQLSWRKTGLLISGNSWIDTGYRSAHNQVLYDDKKFVQQGRVMLRLTPTYTYGNWFVKGQAEILAHAKYADQSPFIDTDDAWVSFGYWDAFDVQFGRYEGWEVYHKGLGLERDTLEDVGAEGGQAVDAYEVNHVFYRESSFGQLALHVYPLDILRFEVNSVLGYQSGDGAIGVRPAAILDLNYIKVKAAIEQKNLAPSQENPKARRLAKLYGFGGSIEGILPPHLEGGVNFAMGYADRYDDQRKLDHLGTYTTLDYGAFLNLRLDGLVPALSGLMVGGGVNVTSQKDQSCSDMLPALDNEGFPLGKVGADGTITPLLEHRCGSDYHRQFYGAVQYDLFDHALLKFVVGGADMTRIPGADANYAFQHNKMWNVRLRFLVWY